MVNEEKRLCDTCWYADLTPENPKDITDGLFVYLNCRAQKSPPNDIIMTGHRMRSLTNQKCETHIEDPCQKCYEDKYHSEELCINCIIYKQGLAGFTFG